MAQPNPWLSGPRPSPGAGLRLFCFPSAGGGAAAYLPWNGRLPAGVELCRVQLPGRESRFVEPPCDRLDDLLAQLEDALQPFLDVPFAFFGHSMGALIGYELTRRLQARGGPAPAALYASGHRAPHMPLRRRRWAELPEAELVAELRELDGIPDEVLANGEILELVLPTMRADLRLYEGYAHVPGEPVACPLAVFGGDADQLVNREELEGWRRHAAAGCEIHLLPGNHFFVQSERDTLLRHLARHLSGLLGSGA